MVTWNTPGEVRDNDRCICREINLHRGAIRPRVIWKCQKLPNYHMIFVMKLAISREGEVSSTGLSTCVSTYRIDQHLQYHRRVKCHQQDYQPVSAPTELTSTCSITGGWSVINRTINLCQHLPSWPALAVSQEGEVSSTGLSTCVSAPTELTSACNITGGWSVINRTINLCVSTYRVDQWILGIHAGIQRCCQRLVGGGVHVKSTGGCTLQQVVKLLLPWWWVIPQLKDAHMCSSLAKPKSWMVFWKMPTCVHHWLNPKLKWSFWKFAHVLC